MTPRRKRSLKKAAAGTAAAALLATACAWTHAKLDIYALIVNTIENLPLASTITFKSPVNFTAAVSGIAAYETDPVWRAWTNGSSAVWTGWQNAKGYGVTNVSMVAFGTANRVTVTGPYLYFENSENGYLCSGVRTSGANYKWTYVEPTPTTIYLTTWDVGGGGSGQYGGQIELGGEAIARKNIIPATSNTVNVGSAAKPAATVYSGSYYAVGKQGKTKTISWISTNGVVWVQTITGGIITGISSNGVAL